MDIDKILSKAEGHKALFYGFMRFCNDTRPSGKALAEEWLRDMLKIGCRDIRCYTTEGIDAPMSDLAALDLLLGDRRTLEWRVYGRCRDMHPDFLAAFLMVNTHRVMGDRNYTLAQYGMTIKWDRKDFNISAESLMKAWDTMI